REDVEKAGWDVTATYFSHDGKYRVVSTNEDARTRIRITEETTGQRVDLSALPKGDIGGVRFADSETKMAFYLEGSRAPADLYVYDFETKKATRLTESL